MPESKEILGASFLGTSGDEAIHCVLDTMYAKAPYTVLQRAMHIHPTVAEFIPTILGDLAPLETASLTADQPPDKVSFEDELNELVGQGRTKS